MVAVAQVQLGQRRHVADDEAQRRVGDVQAGQTQLLHVTQLAAVVQLTWDQHRHREDEEEEMLREFALSENNGKGGAK